MKRFFLGVDVGSTKCHALIADEQGNAIGFGQTGPGNHEGVGYDGLRRSLRECTDQALQIAGVGKDQIAGAGFGVAGYDWPSELAPTLEAIACLGLTAPVEAVNDTIIGLVAGAEAGWGVGLVSGTGCNCWGWDEMHRTGRMTGMGGWFGEHAGGGDLVHQALVAIAYQEFKRGPKTCLTEKFLSLAKVSSTLELLEDLSTEKIYIESSAAPLVFETANEGDEVAQDILKWAGKELGEMANGVIRQINLENKNFDIVLIGSIYKGSPLITQAIQETVHSLAPGARLVRLSAPPVTGGVLIGMQLQGIKPQEVRERLFETAGEFLTVTARG